MIKMENFIYDNKSAQGVAPSSKNPYNNKNHLSLIS